MLKSVEKSLEYFMTSREILAAIQIWYYLGSNETNGAHLFELIENNQSQILKTAKWQQFEAQTKTKAQFNLYLQQSLSTRAKQEGSIVHSSQFKFVSTSSHS